MKPIISRIRNAMAKLEAEGDAAARVDLDPDDMREFMAAVGTEGVPEVTLDHPTFMDVPVREAKTSGVHGLKMIPTSSVKPLSPLRSPS